MSFIEFIANALTFLAKPLQRRPHFWTDKLKVAMVWLMS